MCLGPIYKQLASRPSWDVGCIKIIAQERVTPLTKMSLETVEISAGEDVNFLCETLQVK